MHLGPSNSNTELVANIDVELFILLLTFGAFEPNAGKSFGSSWVLASMSFGVSGRLCYVKEWLVLLGRPGLNAVA